MTTATEAWFAILISFAPFACGDKGAASTAADAGGASQSNAGSGGLSSAAAGSGGLSSAAAGSAGSPSVDAGTAGTSATSPFGACPASLPGAPAARDCAYFRVPLLWNEANGRAIDVLVARYRVENARGQLWLLDGGPGGSGAQWMTPETMAIFLRYGFDVYVPQHRGTGHSTPVDCSSPESLGACSGELQQLWGDGMRGFRSTEAGHDLAYLIDRTRASNEDVFVFGMSYGTYWAQRYLQVAPVQATGVMLDGVLPLGFAPWEGDKGGDLVGRQVLELCGEDPDCLANMGDDPVAVAERVLNSARDPNLRCGGPGGPDFDTVSRTLTLTMAAGYFPFIPAILRRLDRCSASDQLELATARGRAADVGAYQGYGTDPADEYFSTSLSNNVFALDFLGGLSTAILEQKRSERAQLLFRAGGTTLEYIENVFLNWAVHAEPPVDTLPAKTSPLLLMNGSFDMSAPVAWATSLAERTAAPLVVFPGVGHRVDTTTARIEGVIPSCSMRIKEAFMRDPQATLDTSCASSVPPLDFNGKLDETRATAEWLFGTPEMFPR